MTYNPYPSQAHLWDLIGSINATVAKHEDRLQTLEAASAPEPSAQAQDPQAEEIGAQGGSEEPSGVDERRAEARAWANDGWWGVQDGESLADLLLAYGQAQHEATASKCAWSADTRRGARGCESVGRATPPSVGPPPEAG